ncbi:MAG: helicase-associated domain-containing protein [Anaerolineaceae bacterium]|nr:helicase-associated domain-containing protein [Anaerolineaceae bacterium]
MPALFHTLINHDLDMLKIIAAKWGFTPTRLKHAEVAKEMAIWFADPDHFNLVYEILPDEAQNCMMTLVKTGGKMIWGNFLRRFGDIREMGIARRDREAPFASPASSSETLWYYGLIGRAFLDMDGSLQEYAYIPDELLQLPPHVDQPRNEFSMTPADVNMYQVIDQADDRILDHLTSYLAAVRSGRDPNELADKIGKISIRECESLLRSCDLLNSKGIVNTEATRNFLAMTRAEALVFLFTQWQTSQLFNELRLMPGIIVEGVWKNEPLRARQVILDFILGMPDEAWWAINGFISVIKKTYPDFQRHSGDYDSWMLRSRKSGDSLRGFENWDRVDGALIRYLLCGPMHWLGLIDLGRPGIDSRPQAFRLSRMASSLILKKAPEGLAEETGRITALRNGRLICPWNLSRAVRYQVARFCEWDGVNDKGYQYQLTPDSLQNATRQGLKVEQLLTLLKRQAVSNLPGSLVTALQRWAENSIQASLMQVVILRVANHEMMVEIRKSPIGRFLGDELNQTTSILPAAAVQKFIPRLLELGYFCELKGDELSVHSRIK